MEKSRFLLLENGMMFKGKAFGADNCSIGEVVFTTGMTGYMETLTDPSYYGQIVVQTFPLIGNYGIIPDDSESDGVFIKGYIVRDWCQEPSNFRSQGDLDTFLKSRKIPGLFGIDTRELTKVVRESGVMNGRLLDELPNNIDALLEEIKGYAIKNSVENTTCKEISRHEHQGNSEYADRKVKHVVLMDMGAKKNIERELLNHGCDVSMVPAHTSADEILAMKPDGIMISNGPGDPADNTAIIAEIAKLRESGVPIFGICLGHQLLALASGAKTAKLKYGHRGANQPAKCLKNGHVIITSQNHGYYVVDDSLPNFAEMSYLNVNDSTCEGIRYTDKPVFSVQFHPEASAGPLEAETLFDEFVNLMEEVAINAVK